MTGAIACISGTQTAVSRDTFVDDTLPASSGVRGVPTESESGSHLGRLCHHFEITAAIGQGGMGVVYAGWDRALRRRVALKVLLNTGDVRSKEHERFLEEARAQARLSSPHVVHVYYVGHTQLSDTGGESAFFAMELLEGGTLGDLSTRGETLEPGRALEHMRGVAMGLRDALDVGIVHRDIKPSNLLLDCGGKVRIADFGVARYLHPDHDLELTLTGRLVGTPLYMAPEQIRGEPVDHRADMYSLGCTFYHLLAGRPPFQGSTVGEIVGKHLCEKPLGLAEVAPRVPRALADVIERLLEKEPGRRFQSYAALLEALEAAKNPARRVGVPSRAAACAIDVIVAITFARLFGWPGLLLHLGAITVAHARFGQTLGKWLMNIEVRSTGGARIGMLPSLGRTFASLWLPLLVAVTLFMTTGSSSFDLAVSHIQARDVNAFAQCLLAAALGNGVLCALYAAGLSIALLHPAKRAIHDLLLSTEVVYRLP